MNAFRAKMMDRPESGRVIERSDGQIHLFAAFVEGKAERRAALLAEWSARYRRAGVPVRLVLPFDVRSQDILEGSRKASRRVLTHFAMAKVGIIVVDANRIAHPLAQAASGHGLRHGIAPGGVGGNDMCSWTIRNWPSFCR